jgi:hypothetical protein
MQLKRVDEVIVSKNGLASFTRRNMEAFNLDYGDLFYLGVDIRTENELHNKILFIRYNTTDHRSLPNSLIKLTKYQRRGSFYLSPLLKLLKIAPPFICTLEFGRDDYDFALILPDYKVFKITDSKSVGLVPF